MRIALLVAGNQFGKIEVVSCIAAHALRQAAPHPYFLVLVEQ